jgi:protein-tyrosine phosphatase
LPPPAKKSVVRSLCCLLALAILPIAYAIDRHSTLYHFETVDPGKLFRSATLSRRGLEKVYSTTGCKTIINLRSEAERKEGSWYSTEREFALEKGITLVDLPMLPDVPPDADQIKRFLDVVTNPARLPALVHCQMGVIRTGMMVAVYKVAVLKEENRKVWDGLPKFGHSLGNRPAVKEFILNFRPNTGHSALPLQTHQFGPISRSGTAAQ